MQNLNLCLVQPDIIWEQPEANFRKTEKLLERLTQQPDLIVLPEMFATGFTMNAACAQPEQGSILQWMQQTAQRLQCTITGSAMIRQEQSLYNRLFWVNADGQYQCYDKRHLFRFGLEHRYYAAGSQKIITELKGWKFLPLVCYDLRFPVWARNRYLNENFEYDCLIYMANWPHKRAHHWQGLLFARAVENLAYCAGVNRSGTDGNGLFHSGNSLLIDPTGTITQTLSDNEEGITETTLDAGILSTWRASFNAAKDWDEFELK